MKTRAIMQVRLLIDSDDNTEFNEYCHHMSEAVREAIKPVDGESPIEIYGEIEFITE